MGRRFQKAVRERLNLRMAIDGPSGAGKSYTAQRIAMLLAKEYGSRVALIESENRSARKYIGDFPDGIPFDFDDTILSSYSPSEYTSAINDAAADKYGVLVIDSLSHAWMGKDGALELVDKQGKNKFTDGWRTVTPMHNRMIESILAYPGHVIVTMRSKTEYIIEEDEKGRKVPRKVALAPIQRQGMEYEFDIYGSMDWSHVMTVTKSRCSAVDGLIVVKPGASFVSPIISWLNTGEVEPVVNGTKLLRVDDTMLAELTDLAAKKGLKSELLKAELIKRYQVERLADLTPTQAKEFMLKRLGKATVVGRNTGTAVSAQAAEVGDVGTGEGGTPENQPEAEADVATEVVDDESASEPLTTDTLQHAVDTAKPAPVESPDLPISKAMLAQVNRTIARFMKAGGTQDALLKGIRKRNPRATSIADLTWAQAQDLEAVILKKLDGPHDEAQPAEQPENPQ